MSQMGDFGEFCRLFKSEIMEIEWNSPECGWHAGKEMMSKFIQIKKMQNNEQTSWTKKIKTNTK